MDGLSDVVAKLIRYYGYPFVIGLAIGLAVGLLL